MNKRRYFLPVLVVIITCIPIGRVWSNGAERLEEELKFAQALRQMGYTKMAVDQLRRTRGREFLPKKAQLRATKVLAETYRDLGDQAEKQRDFENKRHYYAEAIKEYTRYLDRATKEDLTDRERHDLLFQKGELCAELADDAVVNMKGTTDEDESREYRQTAIKWFKEGRSVLEKAAQFFRKLRADLNVGGGNVEQKILQRKVRVKTGKVQMAYGQLLYDYADLYAQPLVEEEPEETAEEPEEKPGEGDTDEVEKAEKEEEPKNEDAEGDEEEEETKTAEEKNEEKRESLLKTAVETFENVAEEYSIYAVRYKAQRYAGLCYRDLGSFKKAVEYIDKALDVERNQGTAWIIRRSRLNLAQTYNAWGEKDPEKYEKADIAASALVNEVYNRAQVTGNEALVDMLFAAWLEKGRAQIGHGKLLMKKADEAEEKGKQTLAEQRRNQARNQFRWAVEKAQEISARPQSDWSRNAKILLNEWLEQSEELFGRKIKVKKGISTYTAEGWRFFKDEKFFKAIESFQKAIEVGNPAVYSATLIPESWYQIGVAYYKLSSPSHTKGKYTYYYEAALCFDNIVKNYPKAKFAPDAGFYGTQLFGALFDQTQKQVERGQLPEAAEIYDGRRYYEALQEFSKQFPSDPRAQDTIFQSAEVARALEQYDDASDIYARIKQEHPNYYEAKYRAGLCRYLQALKTFEKSEENLPLKQISKTLDRAVKRYVDFIEWYEQNKDWLPAEEVPVVNRWMARTKISFGKLLVHEVWAETRDEAKGAERALKVLSNIEEEHFNDVDDEGFRRKYLPEAFFVTIQAYRRLDQLREAEQFVDDLVDRFGKDQITARAARLLGYAYLQRRDNLEEEGASEPQVKLAAQSAGKYLRKALELEPDQTLEFYNGTAIALIDMEEYGEAIKILEAGLERFPIPEQDAPNDAQMAALAGIKDAYREQEEWDMVVQTVERLLEIEERLNQKRRQEGKAPFKSINYRLDYGLALEKQKKWEEASEYWREAKGLLDEMEKTPETRENKFRATLHLARCYANMGGEKNVTHGYKVMAWYLLSNDDWLRHTDWADKVEELFVDHLPNHMSDLAQFTFQLVQADINLLRQSPSKNIIAELTEKHWPDRQEQLKKLQKQADVELDTGQ